MDLWFCFVPGPHIVVNSPTIKNLGSFMCIVTDKAERLVAGAAACGSQLLVFPEAFVGGYPRGVMFDSATGTHSPEVNQAFQKYYASAINVPGLTLSADNEYFLFECESGA